MAGRHVWGACMVVGGGMRGRGHAWQGDVYGRGAGMAGGCVAGGHAWQGAYVADIMRYGQ